MTGVTPQVTHRTGAGPGRLFTGGELDGPAIWARATRRAAADGRPG